MQRAELEARLRALQARAEPLQSLVHAFASTLTPPIVYHSGDQHYGFRYMKPDVRHFCLLKIVRAISAFNAAAELAKAGYTQEIAVLIRTMIECTTHIEYVLSGVDTNNGPQPAAVKYIEEYFSDYARSSGGNFKRVGVPQKKVHEAVGAVLDGAAPNPAIETERLLSNVYVTFSNYVHAKYPEAMDMYGGVPARFHVCGMAGSPKDDENMETLETFETTLHQSAVRIVLSLNLRSVVERDQSLALWYRSVMGS
jgi:hypothetical protein